MPLFIDKKLPFCYNENDERGNRKFIKASGKEIHYEEEF